MILRVIEHQAFYTGVIEIRTQSLYLQFTKKNMLSKGHKMEVLNKAELQSMTPDPIKWNFSMPQTNIKPALAKRSIGLTVISCNFFTYSEIQETTYLQSLAMELSGKVNSQKTAYSISLCKCETT